MAIIRIFDYVYYRVYHIYKIKWKDSTPGAYATSLVTLLQSLLFAVIPIFVHSAIIDTKVELDKKYFIGIFIVFFIFNYLRYFKVTNYKNLANKWDNEEKVKRRKKGVYVVLFIIITLITFLALVTILGKIHRGEL
jgi:hypothetical protein